MVAQAFHWFDKEKFKKECKRILKENSFVALIWNEVNYKTEIGKQIKKLIEDFTDGNKLYTMDLNENDSLVEKFFDNGFEKKCIDNKLIVTKEQFIGNYLSKSYAPLLDSKRYDEYLKKINKIVDANIKEKVLEIEHKTYIYIGKFKNI